jgi:hypothetical protein
MKESYVPAIQSAALMKYVQFIAPTLISVFFATFGTIAAEITT